MNGAADILTPQTGGERNHPATRREADAGRGAPGRGGPFWRRAVLSRLAALREGTLRVEEGDLTTVLGRPAPDGLGGVARVHGARFWRRVALGGSLGAADAYLDGDWDAEDLTAVLRVLARNEAELARLDGGAWARSALERARHLLRRNTRRGARRNVTAHYDLGNDFFALMLDPTMTYSCGIWEGSGATLEDASVAKMERLCRLLRLGPRDHLVEIGSGWGGFAIHAARRYGCHVTTTTLSPAQHALAVERVRLEGLEGRVRVLLRDYRDLDGKYDKLVSVEMIEAVGADHYQAFFRKCGALLEPGGLAAIQAITIADRHFARALREPDFIRRTIFPGGDIPSTTALLQAATAASDLTLRALEDIGLHYARTLAAWRDNLRANAAKVAVLTTPRFRRTWDLYLAWCEAGFLERYISTVQLLFARPAAR